MREITCFCKKCKKSLRINYVVSGNDNMPVLINVRIACRHCKRQMYLINYTEKLLVENSIGDKFYM